MITNDTDYGNCSATLDFGRKAFLREHSSLVYFFLGGYTLVGVCSFIGNLFVIAIVLFKKDMRSVTNIFIASLAASDFLITAIPFWTAPYHFVRHNWDFGRSACFVAQALGGVGLFWSPFTLAAMAVDRFIVVVTPFSTCAITRPICLLVIFIIWMAAAGLVVPTLIHIQYVEVECFKFCVESWRDPTRVVYGALVLVIRTVIPFGIIGTCHYFINQRLLDQESRLKGHRSSLREMEEIKRKQKLQRLLIAMVVIFGICSFPIDIYQLSQDISMGLGIFFPKNYTTILFLSFHLLSMSGTLWNPLIYALWNENFKRELLSTVVNGQRKITGAAAYVMSRSFAKRSCESNHGFNENDHLLEAAPNRSSLTLSDTGTNITQLHSYESLPIARNRSNTESMKLGELDSLKETED